MKVVGFDGREYKFTPSNEESNVSKRSSLHERAYNLVREVYPFANILQEVGLPGSSTRANGKLRADIFLPVERIIIEVHGSQHSTLSSHFYDSKKDFMLAKARDKKKREWCELNNIRYVELKHNESEEEWREKL